MSRADQDVYFAQFAEVARMLSADPVPTTRADAEVLVATMRPELHADARTREVARLVIHQKAPARAAAPVQRMVMDAAVDLLPHLAQALHGLPARTLSMPAIRLSIRLVAGTMRWAFAEERRPLEKAGTSSR